MAIDKKRLTEMIQHLSKKDLELVNGLVERLITHDQKKVNYQLDDEPTSSEDLQSIHAAYKAMETNELINFLDIENELRN